MGAFGARADEELYLRTDVAMVMQFRVGARSTGDSATDSALPAALRPVPRTPERAAVLDRKLTLGDYQDRLGRSSMMLLNGSHWSMPVTEKRSNFGPHTI
jgi:spore coat protein A, manganese oxidase